MGRPRTPTNVLDARGAFKKNPQRGAARENEPEPNGDIGEPPQGITLDQHEAWKEIVACAPEGVLCKADRIALRVAATLYAEFIRNPADMPAARIARLDSILARFGMTPADRSKVGAPKGGKPKGNAFSSFVGNKGR